mmetsp:Transcript_79976/g.222443  ORF Transcript_79976/g.222443 Transcript_79976/m.222443 type:complete len:200 (+) Transcript_79976:481-1080(+)
MCGSKCCRVPQELLLGASLRRATVGAILFRRLRPAFIQATAASTSRRGARGRKPGVEIRTVHACARDRAPDWSGVLNNRARAFGGRMLESRPMAAWICDISPSVSSTTAIHKRLWQRLESHEVVDGKLKVRLGDAPFDCIVAAQTRHSPNSPLSPCCHVPLHHVHKIDLVRPIPDSERTLTAAGLMRPLECLAVLGCKG